MLYIKHLYTQIRYIQYTALLITASIPLLLPADTRHASWHKVQTLSRHFDDKLVCKAGIFCAQNNRGIDSDSVIPRSLTSLLVTTVADLICPGFECSQYSHARLLCYLGVQHDESQPPRLWLSYKRCLFLQTSVYRPQEGALRAKLGRQQPIQFSGRDI